MISAEEQQRKVDDVLDEWRARSKESQAVWHDDYVTKLVRLGVPLWAATKWLATRRPESVRPPFTAPAKPVWPLRPW